MRALLLVATLLTACSSATRQPGALRGRSPTLTQDELAATNSGNLYDAIAKLRPEWLTSRGPTSVTDPTPTAADVYMNGLALGNVEYLRGVRVLDVNAVRYWPAGEAAARFGMGHPRGVIELMRT
jgi:hypothetical protein